MAEKKTSTTSPSSSEYPEGTHPARPVSEVTDSSLRLKYADNPDKPDPSSVAQIQVKD